MLSFVWGGVLYSVDGFLFKRSVILLKSRSTSTVAHAGPYWTQVDARPCIVTFLPPAHFSARILTNRKPFSLWFGSLRLNILFIIILSFIMGLPRFCDDTTLSAQVWPSLLNTRLFCSVCSWVYIHLITHDVIPSAWLSIGIKLELKHAHLKRFHQLARWNTYKLKQGLDDLSCHNIL